MNKVPSFRFAIITAVVSASVNVIAATANAELVPPVVLSRVAAKYPSGVAPLTAALTVDLILTVTAEGAVNEVTAKASRVAAFDDAAVAAAKQWRFAPARRDGVAIASRIRVPFVFAPESSASSQPASLAISEPGSQPTADSRTVAIASSQPEANPSGAEDTRSTYEVSVVGKRRPPSRGASDYEVEVGALTNVPHKSAAELLKLAPGILLTNDGGEAHAEQVFLRGFDAREGQDIEFSVGGVPINESGNLHGNGYADTHFIIPELVTHLRVVEGPFDPRQGNYAVAGSADYELGLVDRGMTAKVSYGQFNTQRLLLTYGPADGPTGTFAGVELYQTDGFGKNRDGRRGSAMAQYEGRINNASTFHLTAQAYIASFHSAGILRDDDYRSGRIDFYGTYDPRQGADTSRYSASFDIDTKSGAMTLHNQLFAILRPMRLRENFTGFLLDTQQPLQEPHPQRGDLIDLTMLETTIGARGYARLSGTLFHLLQELEFGYFARGDLADGSQARIEAGTNAPYHTETDLFSKLGDLGLYADLNLRPLRWLALRGGLRADVFTYDILNRCAVQSVAHPSNTNPPIDQSCLSQEDFGRYRLPNQNISTSSADLMPRGSLVVGPFYGASLSASAGKGVRSIDPSYVIQDALTPFASVGAYEGGLTYNHQFLPFLLDARSVVFDTHVTQDLIFSETAGRAILGGPTDRVGSANSLRVTGTIFDVAANFTYVHGFFDDTGLLVPYVPDVVVRGDASVFGAVPHLEIMGHEIRGALSAGLTYVAPRPLPQNQRSDSQFVVDLNATLRWRWVQLGVSCTNLFDSRYRLGEYNYASDFHTAPYPTLVPSRMFSAGAPRVLMFSLAVNLGGAQ